MADVKICGLSTAGTVTAAVEAGARFVGFVFFPPSPRNISIETARTLAGDVPPGIAKVGLFVEPDDALLDAVLAQVPLDFIQVHKVHDRTRLQEIRKRTGLPLILAWPVAQTEDVDAALRMAGVADILLFDAKAVEGAPLPGGNGVAFDWRLLANRRITVPWMLAGGLKPETVAHAVTLTGARMVDVSSGVESQPGEKDTGAIKAFVAAATCKPPPIL